MTDIQDEQQVRIQSAIEQQVKRARYVAEVPVESSLEKTMSATDKMPGFFNGLNVEAINPLTKGQEFIKDFCLTDGNMWIPPSYRFIHWWINDCTKDGVWYAVSKISDISIGLTYQAEATNTDKVTIPVDLGARYITVKKSTIRQVLENFRLLFSWLKYMI